MILNGTRFSLPVVLVVLLIMTAAMTGVMFTFHLGAWKFQDDQERRQVEQIKQLNRNTDDLTKILLILNTNAAQEDRQADERFNQSAQQRELLLNISRVVTPIVLDNNEDIENLVRYLNMTDGSNDTVEIDKIDKQYIVINNDTRVNVVDFFPLNVSEFNIAHNASFRGK